MARTKQVTETLEGQDALDYVAEQTIVEFDVAERLSSDAILSTLKRTLKAKADAFTEMEKDFWKPGAPGQPDRLQGVYLGWQKGSGRLIQHAVGVMSETTGKPMPMRFNGTAILTRELRKVEPGTGVLIVYVGQDPGNAEKAGLKRFTLSVLNDSK